MSSDFVLKTGDPFYSIYFVDQDPNDSVDVEIMEHESALNFTQESFEENTSNWFLTKDDAIAAKEIVCGALRLDTFEEGHCE